MKRLYIKITLAWLLMINLLTGSNTNAASKGSFTERANKVRSKIQEKIIKGEAAGLKATKFYSFDKLAEWVNWGNWGNWNNWNNWANWAKWDNWNNWGNWRNY